MQTLIYLIIICGIFLLYLGNKDENKLRKFFLLTNVALFNYSLLILLKFNKLFIGYQYMYKITLTYSKEEYLVYFGVDGLSLFFIILTFFLITLCILITVEKYYKISQLL
jgi:NADH:ubiquinone oxidoreductase subunit 4 (subunit M)